MTRSDISAVVQNVERNASKMVENHLREDENSCYQQEDTGDYKLRQQMMKCLHIVRRCLNCSSENRSFRTAEVIRPSLSQSSLQKVI